MSALSASATAARAMHSFRSDFRKRRVRKDSSASVDEVTRRVAVAATFPAGVSFSLETVAAARVDTAMAADRVWPADSSGAARAAAAAEAAAAFFLIRRRSRLCCSLAFLVAVGSTQPIVLACSFSVSLTPKGAWYPSPAAVKGVA